MGTKDKPGKFDCLAKAEPDEPIFVLLGRDEHAPQLIEEWASQRAASGENPEKVEEARKCAKAMRRWQYERNGAPPCEYCESSGGSCDDELNTATATHIVTEGGYVHWYWCGNFDGYLYKDAGVQTIEGYFATDEVDVFDRIDEDE